MEKITNIVPGPNIPPANPDDTGHNQDAAYIFREFPGLELTRIFTDEDELDKSPTVSGDVPLEYLYLLYRL